MKSIVNIFVVFIKIPCKSRESAFSKQSPLKFSPFVSRKNISCPPLCCQITGSHPLPLPPFFINWGVELWTLIVVSYMTCAYFICNIEYFTDFVLPKKLMISIVMFFMFI